MKTMRITDAELRMIEQHRQSIRLEKAAEKFRREILKLTYAYSIWLDEQGEYPSFSGFISYFNPPHSSNNKLKYDAVITVMNAVNSLQLTKEFDPC